MEAVEPVAEAPVRAPRATAESMAQKQREISVAEFFTKNRHLLGFDNPQKALLTAVRECVDNSLDACSEAGILPAAPRRDRPARRGSLPDRGRGQRPRHRAQADPPGLRQAALRLQVPHPQAAAGPAGHRRLGGGHVRPADHRQARPHPEPHRAARPRPTTSRSPSTPNATSRWCCKDEVLRVGQGPRHAGRDRAAGDLQEGAALGRRLRRADGPRQPPRRDPLHPARARRPSAIPAR